VTLRFRDMLAALYADVPGRVELRVIGIGQDRPIARQFFGPGDADRIAAFCLRYSADELYFGVALRGEADNGTLENCTALTAPFCDLDFKMFAGGEAEARDRLAKCPIAPSIILASGGGLHVYWRLTEPITLSTNERLARGLLARLAAYLGGDLSSAEPAHVLRVPGSKNHKYQPARPVTIELLEPSRSYNVGDFDWLPAEAAPERPAEPASEDVPPGQRDDRIWRMGRALRRQGARAETILEQLRIFNAVQCKPPHPDAYLVAKLTHIMSGPDRADYSGQSETTTGPHASTAASAIVTQLSTVEAVDVDWIWPGRLARGKYALIAGDPGLGKSSIMLDVTARLSKPGSTWPDGTAAPFGKTLLLSAEDGIADTIRPRVDRFGGDPEQIYVLEAVKDHTGRRPLDLARDIAILVEAMRELRPVLVIVDPITAYLGRTDAHRDAEVRGLLAPLIAALEELHIAWAAIAHLNKDQTRSALHRPGGSVAFVAAARLAFALAADPQNEDRRILACLKSNLCRKPDSLAFSFNEDRLVWESGPVVGMDAESLLRSSGSGDREEQTDAERVLNELLDDLTLWPIDASQALAAGKANGIAERTLRRAAGKLGIRVARTGFGKSGRWLWHQPPIGAKADPPLSAVSPMAPMTKQAYKGAIPAIEDIQRQRGGNVSPMDADQAPEQPSPLFFDANGAFDLTPGTPDDMADPIGQRDMEDTRGTF